MVNSNPAVKDLADQITSSDKNKDVEKSLSDLKESIDTLSENNKELDSSLDKLKESIDSLSDEVKKRGVKSTVSPDNKKSNKKDDVLPLSEMLKGFTKGFFNPFTDTDKLVDDMLKAKQEEIPADKLKTSDIETKEDTPETANVDQKEEPVKEKKSKVEKKTTTKDPELNNKLLVSISQMLNELRENTIEKQLLAEAIKIRNILEKENTQIVSAENISSNEQLMAPVPKTPDEQGRIEPYLEEEKQKNTIQRLSANDKNVSAPPVHGEVIIQENNNEEKKAKERELLAQAIADKLADLLGNIGGNTGLNIPDVPGTPDKPGKTPGKPPNKLGGAKIPGKAAGALMLGGILDNLIGEGIGALGLGTSESQHDEIVQNMRKEHEKSKQNDNTQNDNTLDILKNSGILGGDDVAPKPSPMSQYNKDLPAQKELKPIILGGDDVAPKPSPMSQYNKDLPAQKELKPIQLTPKDSQSSGSILQNNKDLPAQKELKPIRLTPKDSQSSGSILQNIFKANEDLKSQETQMFTQQMLPPIISNQTTNNNSQTLMPAPPVPNQNTNSYLQWQKSKVNY